MTVTAESALNSVRASAERLREAAQELVLIAVEDRPRGSEIHLTTQVHDAVLDLAAEAEQAAGALPPEADGERVTPAGAARHVAQCHASVNGLGAVLIRELAAPERITELASLGADHGRESGSWAEEIIRCIETCQHLLWTDVQPALLGYWQELADTTNRTWVPATETELEREGHSHDV
jgi:hypothetical protein